jgi:putative aldouronate transport system substrate-binding protein
MNHRFTRLTKRIFKANHFICTILMSFLILSLMVSFTGCSVSTSSKQEDKTPSTTSTSSADTSISLDAKEPESFFPLKEPITLRYWIEMHGNLLKVVSSYNEIRCYQIIEELTNVKIQWEQPPSGQAAEQFNLMVASGDLPDLIYYGWRSVPGGAQSYIDNEVIIPITEYYNNGELPNYRAYIESIDGLYKEIALDSGDIYMFGCFNSYGHRINSGGWIVRMDWLQDLDMDVPVTIEQWEEVFTAVKNNDVNKNGDPNDEIPLTGTGSVYQFIRAYDLSVDWSVKDGKVVYSRIHDNYREWLATMARWYKNGLIDPEYLTTDSNSLAAKATGNKAFAWYGAAAGNLLNYVSAMKPNNPDVYIRGIPYVQNKDDITNHKIGDAWIGAGTAITTACKNVDVALKWLDFAYSKEGQNLLVYGEEGVSYNWVDGYPKLADIIFNQTGLSPSQAIGKYSIAAAAGAYVKTQEYFEQATNTPEQNETFANWMSGNQSDAIYLPTGITMTAEESATYSEIMNDINTYANKMRDSFIMGLDPLEKFDEYVKTIESMGIDKAIAVYQAAYERFLKRQ